MSANNVVLVRKIDKSLWEVFERDIDSDRYVTRIGQFKSRAKAIQKAQEYCDSEGVEYGIRVVG